MLYYNHRKKNHIKNLQERGVKMSVLIQDISKWEKSKQELKSIKIKVPEIAKKVFPETKKAEIEQKAKDSLKAILETL